MTDLVPFDFHGYNVRVIHLENSEVLFVGKDVADFLGYKRPNEAITAHCRGTVKHRIPTVSGFQDMLCIPERDVYRLIMRSTLPQAEEFEEWVVGEVLPAIRKNGIYTAPQAAKSKDVVEATKLFKSCASVAKMFFKGNQALLSANAATRKITGVDIMQALDVPYLAADKKTEVMTASDIGQQIGGLSAQRVNALLIAIGFQSSFRDKKNKIHYEPTIKGADHSEMVDTQKEHSDGSPIKQLRWHSTVVPFVQRAVDEGIKTVKKAD